MTFIQKIRPVAAGKIGLAVLGALMVSACQSSQQPAEVLASHDYRLKHPIVVTEAPETLDLPIGRNTRHLNGTISSTISSFAVDAQRQGNGKVEILIPSGGANEAAVHAVSKDIRAALRNGGLSGGRVSTRTYSVENPNADAPIRLSYARMQATSSQCGAWPRNIGGGFGENTNYENFGCATQSNLAAMVDNPSDLLTPRASTPADQARRATVYEKYRKGEVTAGDFTEGVGAEVSE